MRPSKAAALQQFMESFGMAAYTTASVPEDVIFPYLTYELITGAFDMGEVSINVNLWFYTESEAIPNAKVQQISERIGPGGLTVPCEGGAIWIKRGSPFAQSLRDDAAPNLKRRYINLDVEYFTAN